MAFEQKPDSGAIFKNDKKAKPTHPDYKGDMNIAGEQFWVSGWIKTGKHGKFLSLAFTRKDAKQERKPASRETPIDLDDREIPF